MKNKVLMIFFVLCYFVQHGFAAGDLKNVPDSAYLFAYSSAKSNGHSGLLFAWSTDRKNWFPIGPEFRYLFCDYGRWGAEKRMLNPYLMKDAAGLWHCIWSLNEREGVFAHSVSKDLLYWAPQYYPRVDSKNNCLQPELSLDAQSGEFVVSWLSENGSERSYAYTTTKDFKTYSASKSYPQEKRLNRRESIKIMNQTEMGVVNKVSWAVVDGLIKKQQLEAYKNSLNSENAHSDSLRFSGLKPLEASFEAQASSSKKISDLLIGVFFEDINYAADGGLYAELIQNRDFEYALSDKEGRDPNWNSSKAWSLNGTGATFTIETNSPIHPANFHYMALTITQKGAGLKNEGYNGIALAAGEKYHFSVLLRSSDKSIANVLVKLVGKNGEICAEALVKAGTKQWARAEAVLTAKTRQTEAHLELVPQTVGHLDLDMVSLFPEKTFKNRKNGLRADLAQAIADIHPRFMRFPGGCVAHGDGLGNIYRWKNTIGPLESRIPQRNLWGYHQTAGLGYFEYFQFCEDMGAEPLPVLAAGVPCQNSATGGAGQQGGIPMCEMDSYIQDILDLIEWANGDAKTPWGRKRAEAGHPKPFNLKYIGIGNEDLINDIFEERFTKIFKAVKEKHPEVTVIGTVGPSAEGTDYEEGWKIASKLSVPIVDEHYYQTPGWFINNQDYYDRYDRSKPKVYLGEYASWGSTLYNALSEALYMTSLERNGDVVSMSSYAPLLAKYGNTQWNPDMIYFSNSEVKPAVNYEVQRLYGQNAGDTYFTNTIQLSNNKNEALSKRVASSVVKDSKTGDLILKLVNLLPVAVNSQLKLDGFGALQAKGKMTVLSGNPNDKTGKLSSTSIAVGEKFVYELPAYSFTVIRIPMLQPADK